MLCYNVTIIVDIAILQGIFDVVSEASKGTSGDVKGVTETLGGQK